MLRLTELSLFLLPFVVFVVWRITAKTGGPSPRVILGAACALLVLFAVLIWLQREEALPPGPYEPATLQDGRVVSGHAQPR